MTWGGDPPSLAEELSQLRKISGLVNFSKITDKVLAEYLAEDMGLTRDSTQYGNEKRVFCSTLYHQNGA